LRDERIFVVAVQCKTFLGIFDSLVAEARAALMAIQVCKEMGFMHFVFEGDAKVVIDAINSPGSDWSKIG
jgi:ribonuclease HI